MAGQPKTEWCVVGFPKCGTSAMARYLEKSPVLHLAKRETALESPFFLTPEGVPEGLYKQDLSNGHKFSAYIYNQDALQRIHDDNPRTLFIICTRDVREVLLSWHKMHRRIANKGFPKTHFVNKTQSANDFYRNCSVEEYFRQFARRRLRHARAIRRMRNKLPEARIAIARQSRLAGAPRAVLTRIHEILGLQVAPEFIDQLPQEKHVSVGSRLLKEHGLPEDIEAQLVNQNEKLERLFSKRFDPDYVL